MAKGRRHGSDRHERLLGSYGYDHGQVASTDQPDFGEEDVWSTAGADDGLDESWGGSARSSTQDLVHEDRARRWLAREDRNVGGLSLAFEGRYDNRPKVLHQLRNVDSPSANQYHHSAAASAPVNVPDWPKVIRADSSESLQGSSEFDADEGDWVPPHEYLAREQGKRAITTSVFEGVGRTLKGRDMSRVRNAVWRQTGFFG